MPTHKEWVVDETGFHAKSVFKTAPAEKTAVYIDDTPYSSGNAKKEEKYEVKLLEGTWLEGEEGFQFNKKCKVQVTGKLLKNTSRTRVTINSFVTFKDEKNKEDVKEDLCQAIDTNLEKVNKDSIEVAVEAEVMLFYGEKYNQALRENPELTCRYTFTAKSNVAKKILESELLEMPKDKIYGGNLLKEGSKDKYVKELQEDLVKLGYWVSNANGTNGMLCSGTFDKYTTGAVITFQRENKLSEDGIVGKITGNKIKECLKKTNYQRLSHKAGNYGEFIQLKPSENYLRYFATYDNSNVLNDIWGTRDTIKLIEDVAKEWNNKDHGVFMVGDISLYNGGKIPNHGSHKDGSCVDIDHNVCSIDKSSFDREKSLILAELFRKHGAKRVLFNCKYVTDNCTIAYPCVDHHNHFHIDTKESGAIDEQKIYLCDKCHSTNNSDCPHKMKEETKDDKKS